MHSQNATITNTYIHTYIYIYIYTCICRISADLSKSVERVRLHLQALKQAASQPASKAASKARQQGSKAARQPGVSQGSQPARQQGSNLSSYRVLTRLPQGATGRHRTLDPEPPPPPPGLEIGAPAHTGVPNSLLWLPCRAQCIPGATKGYQGAAKVSQGLQKSSPADFLRGRRQRR